MSILSSAQQTGALTFELANFESNKGEAAVRLFRQQDDVPKKPFMQATSIIVDGKATVVFPNIPHGEYAAIVFQDENLNGLLDHKFGFPNEPMGFSNDWKLSLFSGMPNFQKLKFEFSSEKTKCKIAIK
jgi:uncharacterized protein (DUF2141 family)